MRGSLQGETRPCDSANALNVFFSRKCSIYGMWKTIIIALAGCCLSIAPVPEVSLLKEVERKKAEPTKWLVTSETDIRLDDKPCTISDIPKNAEVSVLELDAKKGTVLKLYFKTKKPSHDRR